jgi:hypothetical protein
VLFTPSRAGIARAQLALEGVGTPLLVALRPVAQPLPTVLRIATATGAGCTVPAGALVTAAAAQPGTVHWRVTRAPAGARTGCGRRQVASGAALAAGTLRTGRRMQRLDGVRGYTARWCLGALRAGRYLLTVTIANRHGTGPARSAVVTVVA